MKTSFQAAVTILGISLVVALPSQASAGGQGTPGNALNPGATPSVVQADPEGIGIVVASRNPTGLLTIAPTLRNDVATTSGGLRYTAERARGEVELAIAALERLPPSKFRDGLTELAQFAVQRRY